MGICTGIRLGKFTVTPLSRGFEGKPVGYVVRAFRTGCALDILLEPFPFLRSVRTLGQAWLRVEPTWSDANPQLVRLERPSSLAGSGINDLVKFAAPAMIATHFRNREAETLPVARVILEVCEHPECVGCVRDARDQDFNGARQARDFRDDDPAQVARGACRSGNIRVVPEQPGCPQCFH